MVALGVQPLTPLKHLAFLPTQKTQHRDPGARSHNLSGGSLLFRLVLLTFSLPELPLFEV